MQSQFSFTETGQIGPNRAVFLSPARLKFDPDQNS